MEDLKYWAIRFQTPSGAVVGGKIGNVSSSTTPDFFIPPDSVGDVNSSVEDGKFITCFLAEEYGVYTLQRSLNLSIGPWSNVVENISGIGDICITNDTDEAAAFYRVILQ